MKRGAPIAILFSAALTVCACARAPVAAPVPSAVGPEPQIECISRIWIQGNDPLHPEVDVVSVRGPSHSGTGIATVFGHPELEYEIHQNHADHSPMGQPVPYHYAIASGPHHVGCATGTVEAGNILRLDIISGHHGTKERGCFIDFYNIVCAATKQDLEHYLEGDLPMRNAKLETLPSDCVY